MKAPAILLAAFLAIGLGAEPQRNADRFASIEGIVVRAGTGAPISGAIVELTGIAPRTVDGSSSVGRGVISVNVEETAGNGGVLSYKATTGGDGKFEIRNIRPGADYQLIAIRLPEYLPAQYGQRVPAVPGRSIALAQGDHLQDLRIEMTPGGTIAGQVVDSRGLGVRNVIVELRRPWYLEGWRLLLGWNELIGRVQGIGKSNRVGGVQTNARGEFSFSGLAPAQYYVRTGFTNEATVRPINLHAGSIVNDLKIVVPDSGPLSVSGAIFDAGGAPIALGEVLVVPSGIPPLYQRTRVDGSPVRNGVFDVEVPMPGRYVLIARAPGPDSTLRGFREIEVRDTDLRNVRISVVGEFDISGTVAVEGNRTSANAIRDGLLVNLYPLSLETPLQDPVKPSPLNGSFTLESVTAGDYRVEVLPVLTVPPSTLLPPDLENAFVKSVRLDGKDILNGGLQVDSPIRGSMQIVVSLNGGTIEGRVLDDGKPVANVNAVIVPNAARRRRGDLYKYVLTDDDGHFQITGVAPGDYKVFAFERVEVGAWQDPDFIRLHEERGKAVRVEESGRVMTEIELTPAWN
jgi:protocatechuate 3,4-dioxygenase beta subunit